MRQNGDLCDPFVDLQLNPSHKRHMHSEVHQKTQNPVYNQVFEFDVAPYEVEEQTIQFTVLDFSQQFSHQPIGTVLFTIETLDSEAFLAGKEFQLWKKIDKVISGYSLLQVKLICRGRYRGYIVETPSSYLRGNE